MDASMRERVRAFLEELEGECKGRVLIDHPLSRLTTFRIGGPASAVFIPESEAEIETAFELSRNHAMPMKIIGRGSNILASDDGFPGIVMLIVRRGIKGIRENVCEVEVDAGVSMSRLIRWSLERGLGGLEGMAGIPGTIGGAVHNNAGSRGTEISDLLLGMRIYDGEKWSWKGREEISFDYRRSDIGGLIYKVKLQLHKKDRQTLERLYEENMMWRKKSQPLNMFSAGCVFKNGEGYSAGELIERCGCKGWRVGDAVVSEKHANFIINVGRARAWQVFELMEAVRSRVFEETGVELEREIELLGDFPPTVECGEMTFERLESGDTLYRPDIKG